MATKPDTTRHPADGPSVAQIAAVDALMAGATDAAAATAAGARLATTSLTHVCTRPWQRNLGALTPG